MKHFYLEKKNGVKKYNKYTPVNVCKNCKPNFLKYWF